MQTLPEDRNDNKRSELEWAQVERELEEARKWLARAVAAIVGADASFADREQVLLLASNEACPERVNDFETADFEV